jgi:hypothetical protein
MARINVEQKALTDPRFRAVGCMMHALEKLDRSFIEQACGLLMAIRVWDQCQERGTDTLPEILIECIGEGLTDALVGADLAQRIGRKNVRIKGAHERCLWLEAARRNGRTNGVKGAQHGVKGGRPAKESKPPVGGLENPHTGPVWGGGPNPPPAPAPAPAPALKDLIPPNPPAGGECVPADCSSATKTPDPLAVAIAEVSGLDPVTASKRIRTAAAKLAAANPPFTPAEVAEFATRFWELCPWAALRAVQRPTPATIAANIGLVRAGPITRSPPKKRLTPAEASEAAMAKHLAKSGGAT